VIVFELASPRKRVCRISFTLTGAAKHRPFSHRSPVAIRTTAMPFLDPIPRIAAGVRGSVKPRFWIGNKNERMYRPAQADYVP
jgi:hypothetical protein